MAPIATGYFAKRAALARAAVRDIAKHLPAGTYDTGRRQGCPRPANEARRRRCKADLALFCTTYLPERFPLPFSAGQLAEIGTMQRTIQQGGQYAYAAPRGDGKTSRVEAAVLYAALYGFRRFVVVVGSDLSAAMEIVAAVKQALEDSPLLREDFPEVCVAADLADGKAQRASQLTLAGKSLHMAWKADELRLPWIPGSPSAGAVVVARGLTGRLRGMKRVRPDGRSIRPDLILLDDPQSDESAHSDSQCNTRENLILGAVLGSGGGEPIAAFMPCTIIRRGDLAARFLDRQRHPEFSGTVRGMVTTWPAAQATLWAEYAELRRQGPRDGDPTAKAATDFYIAHRAEMDAGAVLDWEHRKFPEELSALQHAENLMADRGEDVFSAEYQNQPLEASAQSVYSLTSVMVEDKVNGLDRGQPQAQAVHTTIGVDVGLSGLHWCACSVTADMSAAVMDYGRFPSDGRDLWTDESTQGQEQAVHAALVDLIRPLAARFPGLTRVAADGNFLLDTVHKACEYLNGVLSCRVTVARGFQGGFTAKTVGNHAGGPVRKVCPEGYEQKVQRGYELRFNSHHWHRVTQSGFLLAPFSAGSVSLFGKPGQRHTLLAEHVTADRLLSVSVGRDGRPVHRWEQIRPDNHLLDALVMAIVAAAIDGADPTAKDTEPKPERVITWKRIPARNNWMTRGFR